MVSLDTMKLLLSIAAILDYDMILMDLVCAFLTTTGNKQRPRRSPTDPPPPDETYYVRRPPGLTDADMPYIMQPAAFIYDHPLAGRALRLDFNTVLIDLGFVSKIQPFILSTEKVVRLLWQPRSMICHYLHLTIPLKNF
jgi:hypothetical protein